MALLATQNIVTTGLAASYAAASGGGDTAVPSSTAFLHVKNGGGSSINVTIATPATVDGDLTVQDRVVAVPNGADRFIALPDAIFRDPTTGLASISYSGVTSVTVAVLTR